MLRELTNEDLVKGKLFTLTEFFDLCFLNVLEGHGYIVKNYNLVDDKYEIDVDDGLNGNLAVDKSVTHILWFSC